MPSSYIQLCNILRNLSQEIRNIKNGLFMYLYTAHIKQHNSDDLSKLTQ